MAIDRLQMVVTKLQIFRNRFEFLQKVFLGLIYSFSCVFWAICSKLFLGRLELALHVIPKITPEQLPG